MAVATSQKAAALIAGLPTEVLDLILALLSTQELLHIATVNYRFHTLVADLINRRLRDSASLPENELLLECYHPSDRLSTPYLYCHYLGTRSLQEEHVPDRESRHGDGCDDGCSPSLPSLKSLYSVFRPAPATPEVQHRFWWARARQPPLEDAAADDAASDDENQAQFGIVTQDINIDQGMSFSQLCAATSVVKEGPRSGLFIEHVNISDGFVRVSRPWLSRMATAQMGPLSGPSGGTGQLLDDDSILWVDQAKSVGLRFRVLLGPSERMPLMTGLYDDPEVSYTLIYEEILVRTSKLLFALEKAAARQTPAAAQGAVIIIA